MSDLHLIKQRRTDDNGDYLDGIKLSCDGDLKYFAEELSRESQLDEIREVVFSSLNIASADFSSLQTLSNLAKIVFLECKFAERDVNALGTLPAIQSLAVIDCSGRLRLDSFRCLEAALEELHVVQSPMRSLDGIQRFAKLQALEMHCDELGDISAIATTKSLRSLLLGTNRGVIDLRVVAKIGTLQRLVVFRSVRNIVALAELRDLKTLYLTGCVGVSVFECFKLSVLLPECMMRFPWESAWWSELYNVCVLVMLIFTRQKANGLGANAGRSKEDDLVT